MPAPDLAERYDVDHTIKFIVDGGYRSVALQFPDEQLADSPAVSQLLQQRLGDRARVFILADTAYNPLGVDEVAAQHLAAQCVIHYGRASLAPVNSLPAFFVLPKDPLDVPATAAAVQQAVQEAAAARGGGGVGGGGGSDDPRTGFFSAVVLLLDQGYQHRLEDLSRAIRDAAPPPPPQQQQQQQQRQQQQQQQQTPWVFARAAARSLSPQQQQQQQQQQSVPRPASAIGGCCGAAPAAAAAAAQAGAAGGSGGGGGGCCAAAATRPGAEAGAGGGPGRDAAGSERGRECCGDGDGGAVAVAAATGADQTAVDATTTTTTSAVVAAEAAATAAAAAGSAGAGSHAAGPAPPPEVGGPQATAGESSPREAPPPPASEPASDGGGSGDASGGGGAACSMAGLSWRLPPGASRRDCLYVWVGPSGSPAHQVLQLTHGTCEWLSYDPAEGAGAAVRQGLSEDTRRLLKRRNFMVERARGANIIGLLVGTLGSAGFLEVIAALRRLASAAGKKTYTFLAGKPNPAKLGNFPEVDVYVMVSDSTGLLLDSRDYLAPLVTPWEAATALTGGHLDPEDYRMEMRDVLDLEAQWRQQQQRQQQTSGEEGEGEDGGCMALQALGGLGLSVATRGSAGSRHEVVARTAAEYLALKRTFKGLETPATGAAPKAAELAVEGLSGRAAVYADEG